MSSLDDFLSWSEPDTGCVSCGKRYVTVADHRCGDCLGRSIRYCPHCLDEIGDVIDREVVGRLRATSHDVNDAWTEGKHYASFRARERVLDARKAARGDS